MTHKALSFFFLALLLCACSKEEYTEEGPDLIPDSKFRYKTLNTSVVIDSLRYGNSMILDLDGDGTSDYFLSTILIEHNDLPYLYLYINRSTTTINQMLIMNSGEENELPASGFWGVPLNKNAEIGPGAAQGAKWTNALSKAALMSASDNGIQRVFAGEWLGKKDKYLGLKFKIKGEFHYGWLRISHTLSESKLAILDYAYNKAAGQPILAGQN